MPQNYFHGPNMTTSAAAEKVLTPLDNTPIGIIVTADDADATFVADVAIEMPDYSDASIALLGTTGTFKSVIETIAAQGVAPKTVVVRVAEGVDAAATEANVLAGIAILKQSATNFDFGLKRFGAPGLESLAVADALADAAQAAGGYAYAAIAGAADDAAAIAARPDYDKKNLGILWPATVQFDGNDVHMAALALGSRVKTDEEVGINKTISNRAVSGVDDLVISIDYDDLTSVANKLNEAHITTIIRRDGEFLMWGNRTSSTDVSWVFETDVLIDNYIAENIRVNTYSDLDSVTDVDYLEDKAIELQIMMDGFAREGLIIDGNIALSPDKNTAAELAQGANYFEYDFTTPKPFEQPNFNGVITNKYLIQVLPDFAANP